MIEVDDMRQIRYNEPTQNRLHSSKKDFFTLIKRSSLRTGIKRKKKGKKLDSMTVLKEGCQAFLSISNKDVFITYSNPEGEQRQLDKCSLRNFLMRRSNAIRIFIQKLQHR